MSIKQPYVHIELMLEAAHDAVSYSEGFDRTAFMADSRTQNAIAFCLILIGEEASKLAHDHSEFAAAHPHIGWAELRGFRNRVIHEYSTVDLDVVWAVVNNRVPSLIEQLEKIAASDRA